MKSSISNLIGSFADILTPAPRGPYDLSPYFRADVPSSFTRLEAEIARRAAAGFDPVDEDGRFVGETEHDCYITLPSGDDLYVGFSYDCSCNHCGDVRCDNLTFTLDVDPEDPAQVAAAKEIRWHKIAAWLTPILTTTVCEDLIDEYDGFDPDRYYGLCY